MRTHSPRHRSRARCVRRTILLEAAPLLLLLLSAATTTTTTTTTTIFSAAEAAAAAAVAVAAAEEAASSSSPVPVARLRDTDAPFPLVGLGCASGVRRSHVLSALRSGYRLLDTARAYVWGYREDEVGSALSEAVSSGLVTREEVFVQTKVHPEDLGYEPTKAAVRSSLERLGVTYIDSVLLHKPRCWEGACAKVPQGTWEESWTALEQLHDAGAVRAIGMCDVTENLLDEMMRRRVKPHVVQNWMDPFHQDVRVRDRCLREGVAYQGYSSLGTQWHHHRGHTQNPVLNDPTLKEIADRYGVSVAQVVIRWATNRGAGVIPASTNEERQRANLLGSFGFDLTEEDMARVDSLDGRPPKATKPDPNEVSITFDNPGTSKLFAYWVKVGTDEEVPVGEIEVGETLSLTTYYGHSFIFRDGVDGEVAGRHLVERDGGTKQKVVVGGSAADEDKEEEL